MSLWSRIANVFRSDRVDRERRVIGEVFGMLLIGVVAGLVAGIASEPYIETLLYEVKGTDITVLATPALPPVIRAVRIDPAVILRSE